MVCASPLFNIGCVVITDISTCCPRVNDGTINKMKNVVRDLHEVFHNMR